MNNTEQPSIIGLIARGYLWVNLPVIIIILTIWYGLWIILNVNYIISIFLGVLAGWYFWAYSINKWIKWAFTNNIGKDRILIVGRLSLLLWHKSTVDNSLNDENK